MPRYPRVACWICLTGLFASAGRLAAEEAPLAQWGERFSRNMVSAERGLPESFDAGQRDSQTGEIKLATTKNVRWVARLGGQTNGTPIVAGGRVYVGTNNEAPRDPRIEGDRGVLLCLDERTGELLWQLTVPKMYEIKYSDWHFVGISSPPTIEGDRVYLVSNRCEVMCLDAKGMANGNDGPYQDEGRHMVPAVGPPDDKDQFAPVDTTPLVPGPKDADILWIHDMVALDGVRPHNASNCSILMDGDLLYVCTSNGVEWTHNQVANPDAPTLLVLDKRDGKRIARDDFNLGAEIIHGQWSSPALGTVGGRKLLFQGTGKGYLFAFEPPAEGSDRLGTVWSFNGHPAAQTQDSVPIEHGYGTQSYEITSNPVFHEGRVYLPITQDPWHTGKTGWLVCIDAAGKGDVTRGGLVWRYDALGMCIATVSIADGLLYVAGFDGKLHCLDAQTGKPHWVHEAGGPIWGSTLVADGKVYLGSGRGTLWILKAGKDLQVISRVRMRDRVNTTPAAAGGVLYVATTKHLYAVGAKPAGE